MTWLMSLSYKVQRQHLTAIAKQFARASKDSTSWQLLPRRLKHSAQRKPLVEAPPLMKWKRYARPAEQP